MQKILTIDGLKASGATIVVAERAYVGSVKSSELIDKIREFDLANATPLMCYDFVRKLKEEL